MNSPIILKFCAQLNNDIILKLHPLLYENHIRKVFFYWKMKQKFYVPTNKFFF